MPEKALKNLSNSFLQSVHRICIYIVFVETGEPNQLYSGFAMEPRLPRNVSIILKVTANLGLCISVYHGIQSIEGAGAALTIYFVVTDVNIFHKDFGFRLIARVYIYICVFFSSEMSESCLHILIDES